MALMTLARFKELLSIADTSLDTQFALYEPIAESRLNCYLGYTLEVLTIGYEPYYARLVYTNISEGVTTATSTQKVKSQAFDGASITYTDDKSTGIALDTDTALNKFSSLKKWYH